MARRDGPEPFPEATPGKNARRVNVCAPRRQYGLTSARLGLTSNGLTPTWASRQEPHFLLRRQFGRTGGRLLRGMATQKRRTLHSILVTTPRDRRSDFWRNVVSGDVFDVVLRIHCGIVRREVWRQGRPTSGGGKGRADHDSWTPLLPRPFLRVDPQILGV